MRPWSTCLLAKFVLVRFEFMLDVFIRFRHEITYTVDFGIKYK